MSPADVLSLAGAYTQLSTLDRQDLILIHPFKGILLKQDVSVLETRQDSILFQATNLKMCAVLAGHTYLHSPALPKPLEARVRELDITTGMLALSDFAYLSAGWETRQHERVSPQCPTYVTAHERSGAFRASMENVSISGMGALAYKLEQVGLDIKPGCKVRLDFSLSPDATCTGIKAVVIYLQSLGISMTRLGLRLYPRSGQIRALESWIMHRQESILEELDQIYWRLRESRRVEYQFF
jgi:hypothetical protein